MTDTNGRDHMVKSFQLGGGNHHELRIDPLPLVDHIGEYMQDYWDDYLV